MTVAASIFAADRLTAVRSTQLLDTGADAAFDRLASLAAELLDAPFAFVTLVDDTRSFWKSCIGVESDDLADRQNAVADSFCQYVVASREPLIVGDTRENDLTKDNPSITSMGVLAWAGFPVFSPDGHALGSFCVVDTRVRKWTARDVGVLSTLSQAVAGEFALRIALGNARAAERVSHDLAATLQESLLPPVPPDVPGMDVAAKYRPAGRGQQVVGDFYDVFGLPDRGAWAASIGDVSGKGVEAAKVTALARHTIRAAATLGGWPTEVLNALNVALLAQSPRTDDSEPRFLTATYAQFGFGAGEIDVRLCSAGHAPTLLRRSNGELAVLASEGMPLGWFTDAQLAETRVSLLAGDSLILYTDGVTEARRGREFFGEARLLAAIDSAPAGATAAELCEAIDRAVIGFGGPEPADDAALLVLRAST